MTGRLRDDAATLSSRLSADLGDDLVSLLLYGSAARGSHVEGRSDVNALLIVRTASSEVLRRAGPALEVWARAGHRPPLIHTEEEWRAAADVFPMEMEDIREAHRLLAGRDPMAGLTTRREDLRRELERETRGVLTRLRSAYAAVGREGPSLEALMADALSALLVLFRAAHRIGGHAPPPEAGAVIGGAAALAGFEPHAFDLALASREGGRVRSLEPFDPAATAYLAAVEQFAAWVNSQGAGE